MYPVEEPDVCRQASNTLTATHPSGVRYNSIHIHAHKYRYTNSQLHPHKICTFYVSVNGRWWQTIQTDRLYETHGKPQSPVQASRLFGICCNRDSVCWLRLSCLCCDAIAETSDAVCLASVFQTFGRRPMASSCQSYGRSRGNNSRISTNFIKYRFHSKKMDPRPQLQSRISPIAPHQRQPQHFQGIYQLKQKYVSMQR